MKIYTNGSAASLVEIDPNNLMSAIEMANKSKSRIRTSDTERWWNYVIDNEIDTFFTVDFGKKHLPRCKATIITKGLMKGYFIYSFEVKRAFYYFNDYSKKEIKPLRVYTRNSISLDYDFVVSYSGKDKEEAREIYKLLSEEFRVFFIDIGHFCS